MQKTLHSKDHLRLLRLLVAARHDADLNQEQVAERLDQHQSFVARYEGGQRRIDVVEFVTIARVLGHDPLKLMAAFIRGDDAAKKARKKRKR